MFSKIFFKIPNEFKIIYHKDSTKRNALRLIMIGILILITQVSVFVLRLNKPFTDNRIIMNAYLVFYVLIILFEIPILSLIIKNYLKTDKKYSVLKRLNYIFIYLIVFWAMVVAIFDQFQHENVVLYFALILIIGFIIDISVIEYFSIIVPIQLIFIMAIHLLKPIIHWESTVLISSFQFTSLSFLINYYTHELLKKNFLNQHLLEITNKELSYLSFYDPLSDLYNRRKWESEFHCSYEKAEKNDKFLSVIVVDIDYFKQYNDTYGHVAGDDIIRQISKLLLAETHDYKCNVGRYGGDEFILSFYDLSEEVVCEISNQITEAVKSLHIVNDKSKINGIITLSIGYFVSKPTQDISPWEFVIRADKALYNKKNSR